MPKEATEKEIKTAFRKLARKHHPDLNPDDKDAHVLIQQINEAYEVLKDPEKYDKYGEHWEHAEEYERAQQQQQQRQRASSEQQRASASGGGGFSDFFSSMFGDTDFSGYGGFGNVQFKGGDYQAELHLTQRQAMETHQQTLSIDGKSVRITVPAGVGDQQKIRLKGYGAPETKEPVPPVIKLDFPFSMLLCVS